MTLSLTKPTVGASTGTWGSTLNSALDAIVTEVNSVETTYLKTATTSASATTTVLSSSITAETLPRLAITAEGGINMSDLPFTLTGITGTATLTYTTSVSHNYNTGDVVVVAGTIVGITGASGTKTVASAPTATTFTVTGQSASGTWTSGGTVQRTWGGHGLGNEGKWNLIVTDPTGVGLSIRGKQGATGQLLLLADYLDQPIFSVPPAGGPAVYGDNFRVHAGTDIFNAIVRLGQDGTGQFNKGDPGGATGVITIGNASVLPVALPDGTHTYQGTNTNPGIILYSVGGRARVMTQGGQHEELNQPTLRRQTVVQKDPALTTVSAIGCPAPTVVGTATTADNALASPLVNLATTTTLNSIAGISPSAYTQLVGAWTPMMWTLITTDASTITNVRYWIGLFSADPALISSPTGIHCAGFRYDTGADGTAFWRTVSSAAGTPTVTTTTAAIAVNTSYQLRIEFNNTNSAIRFCVNDVTVATHTTGLPGFATGISPSVKCTTLTTAVRNIQFAKWVVSSGG